MSICSDSNSCQASTPLCNIQLGQNKQCDYKPSSNADSTTKATDVQTTKPDNNNDNNNQGDLTTKSISVETTANPLITKPNSNQDTATNDNKVTNQVSNQVTDQVPNHVSNQFTNNYSHQITNRVSDQEISQTGATVPDVTIKS